MCVCVANSSLFQKEKKAINMTKNLDRKYLTERGGTTALISMCFGSLDLNFICIMQFH